MPEIKIDHLEIKRTFTNHGWKGEIYQHGADFSIHTISPDGSVFRSSLIEFESSCYDGNCKDYGHSHHWEDSKLIKTLTHAEILYRSISFFVNKLAYQINQVLQ